MRPMRLWGQRLLDALPRPLDPVRSIKVKLGILLVASGAIGLSYFWFRIDELPPTTSAIAIGLALLTSQVLAHGMTSPLREMTAAAGAMARGDYTRRVRATSRDEVGELARAFNLMAADLAAADQHRRELIANVSHELRTPIAALQAVLENVVDGVAAPDSATLRTALAQTERLGRLVTELLDLSRIDAGALRLDLEVFEVAPLLDEVVAEARVVAAMAGRDVCFSVSVQPSGASAFADRARLAQVVLNLLDNAARHSPPAGAVVVAVRTDDRRPSSGGTRRRAGHPAGGATSRLRAVHARGAGHRRWHRSRAVHRALGGGSARRHHRSGRQRP